MGIPTSDDQPTVDLRNEPTDGSANDLWARLTTFEIDDGAAALGFAARLARDNGWSAPFAARAIEEYRRFLFLGQVAGHPVTPSDEVDQVWHLHLTYTRSYWDDLCGAVLGAPFHHGPTRGGSAEADKFDDWYARTLASYRAWFGSEPPADLWPPADRRFGDAPYFVRINTRRQWLVSKPPVGVAAGRSGLLAVTGLALAGCSGGAIGVLAQSSGPTPLMAVIVGIIVVAVIVTLARSFRQTGGSGRAGNSHDSAGAAGGFWFFGGGDGDSSDGGDGGGGGCGGGGCGGGCGA